MAVLNRKVQFVVKSSKFCNLRCRYCYEFADLSNRDSMSLEQLDRMYETIADYYKGTGTRIEFIWHGGEPLLLKPDFYWQTFERQLRFFEDFPVTPANLVQTNLTHLNEEKIRLLKDGFDGVGVSIDLFGGLRATQNGLDSQPRVLKNLDTLRDNKVPHGCITVLTKNNLPYIREMYKFFERVGLSFRLLPLFKGAFDNQHSGFEIDSSDVFEAFSTLVDLWLEGEQTVHVFPIVDLIRQVIHRYTPYAEPGYYDKRDWEELYLVNVNGDLYSYADAYNFEMSHGNVFSEKLRDIVGGPRHLRVIEAAERRIASACKSCEFHGSCSGYPVAEESLVYNEVNAQGEAICTKEKSLLRYIEMRLEQAGFIDRTSRRLLYDIKLPSDRTASLSFTL